MIKYIINRFEGMPRGSEQQTNVNVVVPILSGKTTERLNVSGDNSPS